MLTKRDGVRLASEAIDSYGNQVAELEQESRAVEMSFAEAQQQWESALQQLAAYFLPSCAQYVVQRVATELGATHLPQKMAQYQQQRVQSAARLQQLDADPRYAQRSALLHPASGTITSRITMLQGHAAPLQQSIARFDMQEYQWLVYRDYQNRDRVSGFRKFWNAVTLVSHKESKAWAVVQQQLGHATFAECVAEHNHLNAQMQALQRELGQLEAQKAEVHAIIAEHVRHEAWVHQFEQTATESLRKELVEYLRSRDWNTFHRYIRPEGRTLAAQCHALIHKAQYYRSMLAFLQRETNDRKQRMQSIDRVRQQWARRPHGYMSGDKSKWLTALPAMKKKSTAKRVRWVRSMHRGVHDFDDYDRYGYAMGYAYFYPYDAFSVWSEEPMAYDGFAREVLPDLNEFREQSGINQVDKLAYREAADRGEEELQAEELSAEEAAAEALAAEEVADEVQAFEDVS